MNPTGQHIIFYHSSHETESPEWSYELILCGSNCEFVIDKNTTQKYLLALCTLGAAPAAGPTVYSSDLYLLLLFPNCPSPAFSTLPDSLSPKLVPFNFPSPSGQKGDAVA